MEGLSPEPEPTPDAGTGAILTFAGGAFLASCVADTGSHILLTAAHCVEGYSADQLQVSWAPWAPQRSRVAVSRLVAHGRADLAVLFLVSSCPRLSAFRELSRLAPGDEVHARRSAPARSGPASHERYSGANGTWGREEQWGRSSAPRRGRGRPDAMAARKCSFRTCVIGKTSSGG